MVSLVAPAIAMGNTTIVIPSQAHPLAATDFYACSRPPTFPAGVVNIVTGERDSLAKSWPSTTTWRRCGTSAAARA
jgi:aldehyde dehydrogenase (NAD+)